MSIFDVRKLLPRARRRLSPREKFKGVAGCVRGQPITQAASQKKTQRRANRRAMTKAIVDGLRENPAGSKLLRSFAKTAGFLVQESDGKKDWLRKPTYVECRKWYGALDEAPFLVGKRLPVEQQLRQQAWFITRSGKPDDAVRNMA